MPTASTIRKHLTQAQREKILKYYRCSRLSQREFASQAGISLSTLQLWLRKAAADPPPGANAFVEVPNLLEPSPGGAAYRLRLAGGIDLEIGAGFRPEELSTLLQLLRAL
jgi:transcriptional regulator with XRE-family HTH domain